LPFSPKSLYCAIMANEVGRLAPYWKRIVAFLIDGSVALLTGFLLYLLVGTTYLYEATGGKAAEQNLLSFAFDSGLVAVEKEEDGSYKAEINPYYFAVDEEESKQDGYVLPEDGKEAYEEYYDRVYSYYTVFLASNDDRIVPLYENEASYLAHFNDEVLGLAKETGNPYFEYASSSSSKTAKPVLKDEYQAKVEEGDPATLKALRNYFFDPEASDSSSVGLYYDAILDMMGSSEGGVQTYYQAQNATVTNASSIAQVVSYIPPIIAFFLIVPLAVPGGLTLGKLFLGLRIVGPEKDTCPAYWIRALRALYMTVLMSLFFVPYQFVSIVAFPLFLVDALLLSFGKTNQSLHDRIFKTFVIDVKASRYFKNAEAKEAYLEAHPEEEADPSDVPYGDDPALEAVIKKKDRHWTLEELEAAKEAALRIESFDAYEEAVGQELDALKDQGTPGSVDLTKEGE